MHPLENALAQAYQQADYSTLASLAEQALEQHPEQAFAYQYYGLWCEQQQLWAAAARCFSKAIDLRPDQVDYWLAYAHNQERLGLWEEAANAYRQVLQLEPQQREAHLALGLYACRQAQDEALARYHFDTLIYLHPQDAQAYQGRAEVHYQAGRLEEAYTDLEYALQQQFNKEGALLLLDILAALEREEEADLLYQTLLQRYPQDFSLAYTYAEWLRLRRRYREAQERFLLAFACPDAPQPLGSTPLEAYVQNLLALEQGEEALQWLGKLWELSPPAVEGYWYEWRAQAYGLLGRWSEALADLQQALEACPNVPLLKGSLLVAKAKIHLAQGQMAEALRWVQPLAEESAFADEVAYFQGVVAHQQQQLPKAYPLLLEAIQKGHQLARSYVEKHFRDYLQNIQQRILELHKDNVAVQTQHPYLSTVFGQLWVVESMKSPLFPASSDLNAQQQKKLQRDLMTFGYFMDGQVLGYFLPSTQGLGGLYAYRIEKQKDQLLLLRAQRLDGMDTFTFKLKLEGRSLIISTDEQTIIRLRPCPLDQVPIRLQKRVAESPMAWVKPCWQASSELVATTLLDY